MSAYVRDDVSAEGHTSPSGPTEEKHSLMRNRDFFLYAKGDFR